VGIIEELMEIWPNKVYDTRLLLLLCLKEIPVIFKYDLDYGALGMDLLSISVPLMVLILSQTSFSYISINSLTILMVLKAMESPQKDLLINASHVLKQSILAKISSRSTGNYYVTVY